MIRALVYTDHLRVERDVSMPRAENGEALLRIRMAGVCNTDLELMAGYAGFQGSLGHEFVADVVEGPEALVGQRVVGEINIGCGICDFCASDIPSQCRNRRAVGIHNYPGAFADYLVLPVANLHRVPDEVPDEAAVFTEPLAAALQVPEAVHISPSDQVVLLGAGKLGLLVAQVLKLTGAKVVVPVRRQRQAALLAQWNIPTIEMERLPDQRAQIVVDCTGQPDGFTEAMRLVAPRGTIILKSTYYGLPQVDMTQVAVREIRIVGSRCGPFDAALRLLATGLVDTESMIDARYALDDGVAALNHAAQPGILKVLIVP